MCMCMLNKRAHILFDQELWNILNNLAEREKTSVGKLVRTAIRKYYLEKEEQEQLKDLFEKITNFRETYGKDLAKGKDSTAIIRKMRNERYGKAHIRRLSNY